MSRNHLIRIKSMISNKLSTVTSWSLGLISEYLETLNLILILFDYLEVVVLQAQNYLLFWSTSLRKSLAFFFSSVYSSLLLFGLSLRNQIIIVEMVLSGFELPIDSTSIAIYQGNSKISYLTSNSISPISYLALENYIFFIKGQTASILISSTFFSSSPEF